MPSNKNQHFVLRCHLKPFTLNGEGVAINIFNIPRRSRAPAIQIKPHSANSQPLERFVASA